MAMKAVTIGAGQAAVAFAAKLRELDGDAEILMIGEEESLPYQRPPLSKKYMTGEMEADRLLLRPAEWYDDNRIECRTGTQVTQIDAAAKQVHVGGEAVSFDKLLIATCLLLLAADTDKTIAGWSLWAAIIILCREILVSGLREYLAELKVSVPVTQLAKWKTTVQMLAIGFLLAGPAGDKVLPYTTQTGIVLLWVAALITLYTGYDYFRAGIKHVMD